MENRRYDISRSLIKELEQSFLADQKQYIYPILHKRNKYKVVEVRLYDSFTTPNKAAGDNLPDIILHLEKKKEKENEGNLTNAISIKRCLTSYGGFTDEQISLINTIKKICEEQDEIFLQENAAINSNNERLKRKLQEAQLGRNNTGKKPQITPEEDEDEPVIGKQDDEDGNIIPKTQWKKLYEAAKDDTSRSPYERRAVMYNHTLYCNAARALKDFDMDPKSGNKLYEACERGHYYNGRVCEYATPGQILSFIHKYYPDTEEE